MYIHYKKKHTDPWTCAKRNHHLHKPHAWLRLKTFKIACVYIAANKTPVNIELIKILTLPSITSIIT